MQKINRYKLKLEIWWNLLIALIQLKTVGFNKMKGKLESNSEKIYNNKRDKILAIRIARETYRTAAKFPGKADCLPRSICIYRILINRGYDVNLILGVKRPQFLAHAWVEYNGRPITDPINNVIQFTPIWSTKKLKHLRNH